MLSEEVRNSTSINIFKSRLNGSKTKVSPLFSYGERKFQIIHSRLRRSCSCLNEHLFRKNIVHSPLCHCGFVESTSHFFFECTRYSDIRQSLIDAVSNFTTPSLHVLLNGDDSLSIDENNDIFQAVHQFIRLSKRFDI